MGGSVLDRFADVPPAGPGLAVSPRRALPHWPRVSMVCPTVGDRWSYHASLYSQFVAQDYPAVDLWVLDDATSPSPVLVDAARADPRVHYHFAPADSSGEKMSLGAARNWLLEHCTGNVVCHLDDDDVVARGYVTQMLYELIMRDLDFVKLASWNERRELTGAASTWAPSAEDDANLWGWGFSYVYRRSVAARVSFPEIGHAEDYAFVKGLRAAGLKLGLVHGAAALVEHTIHGMNFLRPL